MCFLFCHLQLQYQAMGLFDSFEEDTPHSPSIIIPTINIEELFDDPKYVSSTAVQVQVNSVQCCVSITAWSNWTRYTLYNVPLSNNNTMWIR